ncbi:Protein of unknown function (DUF2889) [Frankia torreyi]|uniref:DUF2889 domain-containing protein n=1 Tax=Frankia torreyi TaxID=1856 RepID=A0A0D8B9Q8_9ACTN|nr:MULTISPECIES: DUF2889 domain-containing protein [Frankia]KJE20916.1 Protein of unknown function (DUF2889) [Frankia torreyi]KQC37204.1 hypothetical protein UK82_16730 [Frankia sp. ACN1ag]KQM07767.1 Protein of unknown function (DUF2889) [Frankia sp. CpI1-P]
MIRAGHPGHGPRIPAAATPRRRPGSIRRTSTVDIVGGRELSGPLVLRGRGRDLLTDPAGTGFELAHAAVEVEIDRTARPAVARVTADPPLPGAEALVGASVPGGFRKAIAAALPAEGSSLGHLLLDDVPGAVIISGYAWAVEPGENGPHPGGMAQADICSGWRSDGTMMVSLRRAGGLPPMAGPVAPDLADPDDPAAWHELAPLGVHGVRRRRRLDLTVHDGLLDVDAMFRDTYVDSDGDETVVHEYGLSAGIDAATFTVVTVAAQPRVLPWVECPLAGASADRLVGTDVRAVRGLVGGAFRGISTCTHLNDLLRSLGDVEALAAALGKNSGAVRPVSL